MDLEQALRIVKMLINSGVQQEAAINNPAIPPEFQEHIKERLEEEENIVLAPPRILVAGTQQGDWLRQSDRSTWYYWRKLREYLLVTKNRSLPSVRSLDETTDRILGQLSDPSVERFNVRGLVIGYVQSGKTSNYTALIAKAVDVGYRFIIVLSGSDNGLRRQTQIRLDQELVGYPNNPDNAVPLPPLGKQWHQFTSEDLQGDFRRGHANHAALQGTQPVLLVVKKNGSVLRRLHEWIDEAPDDVRRTLPVLVVDDEADLASIDTRGSYQLEDDAELDDDYTPPSIINALIRDLLRKFQRCVYVAYTATPFANILIPHDNYDPVVENDLYPKDFIVDLPKPNGYFGAEELFGRFDAESAEEIGGLNVIRPVSEEELNELERHKILPSSLETALMDFVLAGAARAQRGQGNLPSTMLLHGSHLVLKQLELFHLVSEKFAEIKDEWRYQRPYSSQKFRERWENEFRPVIRENHLDKDVPFAEIEEHLNVFLEAVQILVINSSTGSVLDYEREPDLKAIAIGGNRLSRGLTLEGLLTSYFFRPTIMYDTLMQMGRWFGFREGYEDLTRIYMTGQLSSWFSDLARVEHELRQDIGMYEARNVTPMELGARIATHPSMLVTSRLKQRYARTIVVEQSYSNQLVQTFKFPFQQPGLLNNLLDENIKLTKAFVSQLGNPNWEDAGPVWQNVGQDKILKYLESYRIDQNVWGMYTPLVVDYIKRQNEYGELINWTIAIRGRETEDSVLQAFDFGIERSIPMISRTRIADLDSLGVITNPGDEQIGLTADQIEQARVLQENQENPIGINPAARRVRLSTNGLLLIYPISRFSGYERTPRYGRRPIYDDPQIPEHKDVIGLAISFPPTEHEQDVRGEYLVGTVDWNPYDIN